MSNRLFRIIFNFYGSSGNLQFDTMGELRLSPFRSIRQPSGENAMNYL